jgi:hypothetical protein
MIRSLFVVTALCLWSACVSAAPLTIQQCKAKYQAAQAAGTRAGEPWDSFQEKQCGIKHPPRRPKHSK